MRKKTTKKKTAAPPVSAVRTTSLTDGMIVEINNTGAIHFDEPSPQDWDDWFKATLKATEMKIDKIAADASIFFFDKYFSGAVNITVANASGKEVLLTGNTLQFLSAMKKMQILFVAFNTRPSFTGIEIKNS